MLKKILEIKDSTSRVTACLLINTNPDIAEDIHQVLELLSKIKKVDRDVNSEILKSNVPREQVMAVLTKYQNLWETCKNLSQIAEDYLLTHERFHKKLDERWNLAMEDTSDPKSLESNLLKIQKLKTKLIDFSVKPVTIQRRKIKHQKIKKEYNELLGDLENKIPDLRTKAVYLYR